MNKTVITLIAATFALNAMPVTSADSASGTYVGASPGFFAVTWSGMSILVPGSNFGGYNFPAGQTPVSAEVADATGNPVYFEVCQDTDLDSLCGETADGITQLTDEPSAAGCGAPVDLTTGGFSASSETVVFVWSTSLPDSACIGTATTGTIIINYA